MELFVHLLCHCPSSLFAWRQIYHFYIMDIWVTLYGDMCPELKRKQCILLKNLKALMTCLLQILLSSGAELLVALVGSEISVESSRHQFSAETSGSSSWVCRSWEFGQEPREVYACFRTPFLCPHSVTRSLKYPCQHQSVISAFSPPSPTILWLDSASLM